MSSKVTPVEDGDPFKLNHSSLLYAKYFNCKITIFYCLVNIYDIKRLKVQYKTTKESLKQIPIFMYGFIADLQIGYKPVFDQIFSIFKNGVHWNDFFQFILFFSLAPMVCTFYFLLNILDSYDGKITWEVINKIAALLDTDHYLDSTSFEFFKHLDLNGDGHISLKHFFNYISRTYLVWEPLYLFRIAVVRRYFPGHRMEVIMNRKLNIQLIKTYQNVHNGKYPNEHCISKIKRVWSGEPPPSRYDYTCELGEISFSDITINFITKYNSNYIFSRETFPLKYLTFYKQFEILGKIDQYYVQFRKLVPTRYSVGGRRVSSNSSLASEYANNTNRSTTSILRPGTSNYSSRKSNTDFDQL